jgi:hypothetical protein
MMSGTVIVFDEYWNYPGWREHEYKALEQSGIKVRPFAFVPSHQQAGFVVI